MPLDSFLAAKVHLLEGLSWADRDDPAVAHRFAEFEVDPAAWVTPPGVSIEDRTIDGPRGRIPIRSYRSSAGQEAVLVWLHGGGFSGGDVDMPESHVVAVELAARAGVTVVTVGYRLARDGVRYPVPVDDAEAAWCWVVDQGCPDAGSYALGGASAGATLALSTALRHRASPRRPDRLLLAYPFAHFPVPALDSSTAADMQLLPLAMRFEPATIAETVRNYVGRISDLPADAIPGAGDLSGLPPTSVVLSELDDLRGSGELLLEQLAEVGVAADAYLATGMPHGHLNRTPSLREVDLSLEYLAGALKDMARTGRDRTA
ncbi:alpha/beta hydrolase fold domain-containing protein [Amycolatopsis sp. MtRt-6]|uniref:alpha/beta hydrolase fold domain-containing protein n=1 Tax=Amycolatopsis sp. MtRt-6 TaxID=2792782 RepID=UPI001A8EB2E5|nr:alpha/beta hydrolase fold domain-containing protein [Amycolatopsis sp. MtRt-6]